MADSPDADLIAAARSGDREALELLLERYEPQIYRFGLRMCGDEESAREVLQETLLAAFRHLPGFRGEAALSTWLYQIARSFCIKERRDVRPTMSIDDAPATELVDPAPGTDLRAHAREIGGALSRAITALPAEQREALVLRDVEGLSAEEAAQIAGVDVGALKSRLHRARMTVRRELAAWLEGGTTEPCPELARSLTSYAGAEIDQAACAQIEAHLATCPRCAAGCDALQRTVSLCKRIPGGVVPASVRSAVRAAIAKTIGTTWRDHAI
ncbi:MAG: sigma-70 family RNA polymerase sigma factor [Kofleriaceae bacterium]